MSKLLWILSVAMIGGGLAIAQTMPRYQSRFAEDMSLTRHSQPGPTPKTIDSVEQAEEQFSEVALQYIDICNSIRNPSGGQGDFADYMEFGLKRGLSRDDTYQLRLQCLMYFYGYAAGAGVDLREEGQD